MRYMFELIKIVVNFLRGIIYIVKETTGSKSIRMLCVIVDVLLIFTPIGLQIAAFIVGTYFDTGGIRPMA